MHSSRPRESTRLLHDLLRWASPSCGPVSSTTIALFPQSPGVLSHGPLWTNAIDCYDPMLVILCNRQFNATLELELLCTKYKQVMFTISAFFRLWGQTLPVKVNDLGIIGGNSKVGFQPASAYCVLSFGSVANTCDLMELSTFQEKEGKWQWRESGNI